MELLVSGMIIGFAAILNHAYTLAKLRQMKKIIPRRPPNCDKDEEDTHSFLDNQTRCRQEASMQRANMQFLRPCVIMHEIMEVGKLAFNRNGKQWGNPLPKFSCLLQQTPKVAGPQANGESLTKNAAERNLCLFDELCIVLERDRLKLLEIARFTKLRALDFYNILVQSCVKMGKKDKVAEILIHMAKHKVPRNVGFCEGVLKQFAAARWFKEALQVYPVLTSEGLEPSAIMCSCMICFTADCGEHECAKHFFSRLRSMATPNLRTCITMLKVHREQGDWKAAMGIYRDMQTHKVTIDSQVLNMVMRICAAAGMANEVEQLLSEAEADVSESTVQPVAAQTSLRIPCIDIASYNTAINVHAIRGDYPAAVKVLMRIHTHGLKPNVVTYHALIDAAACAGKAATAWEVYEDMISCGLPHDKNTCSILVKTLSPNPTGDCIHKFLDLLGEVGTRCDSKLKTRLYHSTIKAALQLEDSKILVRLFAQAQQHHAWPTAESCRELKKLVGTVQGPSLQDIDSGGG